jgi:hypothetical protein
MSITPQTSFISKPTESRVLLLQAAALHLFEDGVIAHPSNAAISKYDETENVARYIHLFHDWFPDWAHLKFHDFHLNEELRKFLAKASQLASESNPVAAKYASAYLGKKSLEQLSIIGDQLKYISFYSPATGGILHSIRQSGKCWNYIKLDQTYLRRTIPGRVEAETKAGKIGHWDYGIELEQIYLSTEYFTVFGEYFLQDKQNGEILAITAACTSTTNAEKLANLDKVLQYFKTKFIPLPRPPQQTSVAMQPKRTPKIPTAAELAAKLPQTGVHKEQDRRNKIVEEINKLSDQQRTKLAVLAVPESGETHVPLIDMETALKKVQEEGGKHED